jgi:hypothetical protein
LDVEFFFGRSVAPPGTSEKSASNNGWFSSNYIVSRLGTGWYMLFIVDSEGVPSKAKILSLPAP